MRSTSRPAGRDDRGQATPLVVAAMGLAVLAMLALGPFARALVARTEARRAADAAALAGAVDGEGAARSLAAANDGELVHFETGDARVVVEVRVGDATAQAAASATRRAPSPPAAGDGDGDGDGARVGLAPAMRAALARADALLGRRVPVVSGRRSRAEQQALWDRRATNPYPVARPGTSDHETGLAVDVRRAAVAEVLFVAEAAHLCRPLPESDPVHFVVCGT